MKGEKDGKTLSMWIGFRVMVLKLEFWCRCLSRCECGVRLIGALGWGTGLGPRVGELVLYTPTLNRFILLITKAIPKMSKAPSSRGSLISPQQRRIEHR